MRSNWFRAVLVAASAAALAGLATIRPAVAADNRTYFYVHDIAGFVYGTQIDPRNGKLLRRGQIGAALTSPAAAADAQTLAYSPRLRLMVVSNGNGGAGTGTLTVMRVLVDGQLQIVNLLFPVPGSGDLTNVEVVETAARVMVYATDPTTNQIFTLLLNRTGGLTPVGAPIASAIPQPRGIGAARNFLYIGNGVGGALQVYPVQPTGTLLTPPILVPLTGAVNPRFVRAQNDLVFVADCGTFPPDAASLGRLFGFRFGGTRQFRPLLGSPFVTADANPCAISLANNFLLAVGLSAGTNLQTGVLQRGVLKGRGTVVATRQPYEVAKFLPRADYVVAARAGEFAEVRSFRIGQVNATFRLIQGGVGPLQGALTLNGIRGGAE